MLATRGGSSAQVLDFAAAYPAGRSRRRARLARGRCRAGRRRDRIGRQERIGVRRLERRVLASRASGGWLEAQPGGALEGKFGPGQGGGAVQRADVQAVAEPAPGGEPALQRDGLSVIGGPPGGNLFRYRAEFE